MHSINARLRLLGEPKRSLHARSQVSLLLPALCANSVQRRAACSGLAETEQLALAGAHKDPAHKPLAPSTQAATLKLADWPHLQENGHAEAQPEQLAHAGAHKDPVRKPSPSSEAAALKPADQPHHNPLRSKQRRCTEQLVLTSLTLRG